ncbi:hypothetical protein FY528_10155 [Hymenobacter lutimineralis]|uniref:Uncharacterized protein n=1 Tax=Hymenobacter lutimineralis TaxID=2606448 RepID=A0A5D6V216_9BACT|nr:MULTISPECIES: hypothetical protein [Hymenobacter]QIX60960.1 hypothetical protein HER32_07095 [Hymenobacter sp. BT18]TYZ09596.1 hypothetical protein FY528_10155 [Hymenobacter lutimineralis]
MTLTLNPFLTRLRLVLLQLTLLWVLGLNHQAVAMYRVVAAAPGHATRVGAAPKGAVVKQKVTLEATAPLGVWLAPATEAWLPPVPVLPGWPLPTRASIVGAPRPCAVPDAFRTRLLGASVSPHAP